MKKRMSLVDEFMEIELGIPDFYFYYYDIKRGFGHGAKNLIIYIIHPIYFEKGIVKIIKFTSYCGGAWKGEYWTRRGATLMKVKRFFKKYNLWNEFEDVVKKKEERSKESYESFKKRRLELGLNFNDVYVPFIEWYRNITKESLKRWERIKKFGFSYVWEEDAKEIKRMDELLMSVFDCGDDDNKCNNL